MTRRVAFPSNHDQAHQVAHSLSVALALARSGVDAEVGLASTHARITAEIRRICARSGASAPAVVELGLRSAPAKGLDAVLEIRRRPGGS